MRRFDLDWLRVIVFGILIFYHVGMFFVPWDYHIKNDIIYPNLRWPMLFVNQWRLAILFVISGMGTYFALSNKTGKQFSKERLKRLLIPLIAGILLIVPPQVYIERLVQGEVYNDYLSFWPLDAFIGIYPEGNFSWHHLWFLPYLLFFSLVFVPVFLFLKNNPENMIINFARKIVSKPHGLYYFIIPLFLWQILLKPHFPSTHALIDDWFNLVNYGTLFFYGFLLISIKDIFWSTVSKYRRMFLYLGIVSFALLAILWLNYQNSFIFQITDSVLIVFNLWTWILVLFGYSSVYLNKSNAFLTYANEAVYPFYILHQTITIGLGYYMMHLDFGFGYKYFTMSLGTFIIVLVIYEFGIRRWAFIRPIFGLKSVKAEITKPRKPLL